MMKPILQGLRESLSDIDTDLNVTDTKAPEHRAKKVHPSSEGGTVDNQLVTLEGAVDDTTWLKVCMYLKSFSTKAGSA